MSSVADTAQAAGPSHEHLTPEEAARARMNVIEEHRWLWFLVPAFVVTAVFFALAIGTGSQWWMIPAFVLGILPIIATFLYLGLSSALKGT